MDVYLTHWSFRLSQPQQNWGQSLQYRQNFERIARREGQASFEEVVKAMDKLVKETGDRGDVPDILELPRQVPLEPT